MHRHTRTMIRLAACASLLLLAACPPENGACDRPSRQTIVFYDQSASSVADSATAAMFRDTLREVLRNDLTCPGDAVRGFLVHGNTRGKVGRVDVERTLPPLDTTGMSMIQQAREKARYSRAMERFQADGEGRLAALLAARVDPRHRAHTDLVGALEVVQDVVAGADSGAAVRVVYLSDMRESMGAPRRDFDTAPPTSAAQAEAWADADTVVLRDLRIDPEAMRRVEVRVLMGSLADKPRAPEIRRYWERLFRHAGVRHVEYN